MNISDFLEQHYLIEKSISDTHANNLRRTVRYFVQSLGSELNLSELTPERVNKWLIECEESGKWKPKTIQNMRAGILAIWSHAIESDICDITSIRPR